MELGLYDSKGSELSIIWFQKLGAKHHMARKARSLKLYGLEKLGT